MLVSWNWNYRGLLVSGRQSQQIIKVKGYLRYFYSLLHNAMLHHQGIMIH